MARQRFQEGCVFKRGSKRKVWVARWYEWVIGKDGPLTRAYRSEVLGAVAEMTKGQAKEKLAARFHDNAVTDVHILRENADLLSVAQYPAAVGKDLGDLPNGSLRSLKREMFQALTEHADEDNLGGDKRLTDEDGGDAGDGQGNIGADPALEETFKRAIQNPRSTDDGCGQRDPVAAKLIRPGQD